MSLTGKPPQDLAFSNLAVKDTLVATQTTAINVNAVTINGICTTTSLEPIRSVFTGAEIGQWSINAGIESFTINGIINDGPAITLRGTVLGQVDNYPGGSVITCSGFIYCPAAPSSVEAGIITTFTINEKGQFSVDDSTKPGNSGSCAVKFKNRRGDCVR